MGVTRTPDGRRRAARCGGEVKWGGGVWSAAESGRAVACVCLWES